MKQKLISILPSAAMALAMVLMPIMASAQRSEIDRRNQTRDEWKNIATVSGGLAILGALTKDKTLTFGGSAGALYSLYRYDQDTKSRDRTARLRAEYFSRDHFYRDGVRYDRETVTRNGQRYYQFKKERGWEKKWHRDNASDNGQWHREHGGRRHGGG